MQAFRRGQSLAVLFERDGAGRDLPLELGRLGLRSFQFHNADIVRPGAIDDRWVNEDLVIGFHGEQCYRRRDSGNNDTAEATDEFEDSGDH